MSEKKQKNSKENFYFIIEREGSSTSFRFCNPGRNGGTPGVPPKQIPDFRQYTGIQRELLREFLAYRQAL